MFSITRHASGLLACAVFMAFDPASFTQQTVQAEGATAIKPVPEGEYIAMIDDGDITKWFAEVEITKETSARKGEKFVRARIPFVINDEQLQKSLGRTKIIVAKDAILDFVDNDSEKGLDMSEGKNVSLNQVREALGQNKASISWSFQMLAGAGPVRIKVKHRPNEKNPDAGPFTEVTTVVNIKGASTSKARR